MSPASGGMVARVEWVRGSRSATARTPRQCPHHDPFHISVVHAAVLVLSRWRDYGCVAQFRVSSCLVLNKEPIVY